MIIIQQLDSGMVVTELTGVDEDKAAAMVAQLGKEKGAAANRIAITAKGELADVIAAAIAGPA